MRANIYAIGVTLFLMIVFRIESIISTTYDSKEMCSLSTTF